MAFFQLSLPLSLIRVRPRLHAKLFSAANLSATATTTGTPTLPLERNFLKPPHSMSAGMDLSQNQRSEDGGDDGEHTNEPPCKTVAAATIAQGLLGEVKRSIERLERPPLLVGFLANSDPAARMYANWTEKTCAQNGVRFELRQVDKDDLEEEILAANVDDAVGGIIVYYPVFGSKQDSYLQQITCASKDVEGLSHAYLFNMYQNVRYLDAFKQQKSILPCTPLAIIKILEHVSVYNPVLPYGNRLFGKTVTVVNRSEIVGRPLAALLANDGASVYSVDVAGVQHFTRGEGIRRRRHQVHDTTLRLEDVVPRSDVVITGVPNKNYKFPVELLKEGTVCVNFSSEKNFDATVKQKASIYVPAIGKVTIVVLLRNLLRLIENRQHRDASVDRNVEIALQGQGA